MVSRVVNPPKTNSFFLFGPRGSGKTSYLRDRFKDTQCLWIDLLDDEVLDRYQVNPQLLREEIEGLIGKKMKPEWVIIDVVQKAPKLF